MNHSGTTPASPGGSRSNSGVFVGLAPGWIRNGFGLRSEGPGLLGRVPRTGTLRIKCFLGVAPSLRLLSAFEALSIYEILKIGENFYDGPLL